MNKFINLAVCGAHMSGLPLNHQLTQLGATLIKVTSTTKGYRLFDVPEKTPPRPGMLKDSKSESSIELEVWSMPLENFGAFMIQIASPLCIGSVVLEDNSCVYGFLCENDALTTAKEISSYGGWRAYITSTS